MITLLSVHFFDSSMPVLIENIRKKLLRNEHIYVCITSLHGLFQAQDDKVFQRILNKAGFTVCDGMPIVWLGNIIKSSNVRRIYGPDLMLRVCEMAEKNGTAIFLFGTTDATLALLSFNLKNKFPKLIIAGTCAPPFRPLTKNENIRIFNQINTSQAKVVFVGLGTPKQEQWMYMARQHITANVSLGVGAAFDFIAGTKRQAPVWVRSIGFEWIFRLIQEPRRLGKRYATIIFYLLRLFANILMKKMQTLLSR